MDSRFANHPFRMHRDVHAAPDDALVNVAVAVPRSLCIAVLQHCALVIRMLRHALTEAAKGPLNHLEQEAKQMNFIHTGDTCITAPLRMKWRNGSALRRFAWPSALTLALSVITMTGARAQDFKPVPVSKEVVRVIIARHPEYRQFFSSVTTRENEEQVVCTDPKGMAIYEEAMTTEEGKAAMNRSISSGDGKVALSEKVEQDGQALDRSGAQFKPVPVDGAIVQRIILSEPDYAAHFKVSASNKAEATCISEAGMKRYEQQLADMKNGSAFTIGGMERSSEQAIQPEGQSTSDAPDAMRGPEP